MFEEIPNAISRAGKTESVMGLNLKQQQPPGDEQNNGAEQADGPAQDDAASGSGMIDRLMEKGRSLLGIEGDASSGEAQLGEGAAQEEALQSGRKAILGAPVLFTHPDGQKTYAAIIGGIREHGGCDLFILKPGDCHWEPNIRQGEGPNMWRPNYGDQQ